MTLQSLEEIMVREGILKPGTDISPHDNLEALGLDSLDRVELAMHCEVEGGINASAEEEYTWKTIQDILDAYENK